MTAHRYPPRQLAQIILVAGRLTIVGILFIKPCTVQGDVARLRMGGLVTHGRTKSLDHAAGTYQEGKGMKVILAVKTHRQIAGDIDPQGHIVPLTG